MGIQDWSENVVLVELPSEPDMCDELKTVTDVIRQKKDSSVVIDFSDADIITSSSLAQLLRLQKILDDHNQQLILCGAGTRTLGVFKVTGLDKVFEFVTDRFMALAGMQLTE